MISISYYKSNTMTFKPMKVLTVRLDDRTIKELERLARLHKVRPRTLARQLLIRSMIHIAGKYPKEGF